MNKMNNYFLNKSVAVFIKTLTILLIIALVNTFSSLLMGYGCRSHNNFSIYESPYYEIDDPFEDYNLDALYQESENILGEIREAIAGKDLKTARELHYSFLKRVRAIPSKSKILSSQKYAYVEQIVNELVAGARQLHRAIRQNEDNDSIAELVDQLGNLLESLKQYYPKNILSNQK